jgi:hypothetical protein
MSTRPRTDDTRTTETPTTRTTRTDTGGAPLMFATDNEVQIQGLFEAESDDHGA